MEYKGVKYTAVQTASPTGWIWRFQIEGQREKKGITYSRPMAVAQACAAIDKALSRRPSSAA
jgi:hypothetical protein